MTSLRLYRFDSTSNKPDIIGRFEINNIETDAFRLEAFIVNGSDAGADIKVLDIDTVADWLENPGKSGLIVASSDTATFLLYKDNDDEHVQRFPRGN